MDNDTKYWSNGLVGTGVGITANDSGTTKYWSQGLVSGYVFTGGVPTIELKTVNGIARANIKTINGIALANIKTYNGISNV